MNTTPHASVLALRFTGPAKALSQLSPKLVAKALHKSLGVLADAHRDPSGADTVLVSVPDIDLLTLREAWAKGLYDGHQGLRATELVVFREAIDPSQRGSLERSAKRVVALSRG